LVCLRVGSEWIVERDQPVLAVAEVAEIAVPHGNRRNTVLVRGICPLAKTFPGHKKERSIPAMVELGDENGTADCKPEFVPVQVRRLGKGILPAACDADPAVAVRFEQGTVELVRTALAAEQNRNRPCKLRRGVVGFDVHFLQCVQTRYTTEVPSFPNFV